MCSKLNALAARWLAPNPYSGCAKCCICDGPIERGTADSSGLAHADCSAKVLADLDDERDGSWADGEWTPGEADWADYAANGPDADWPGEDRVLADAAVDESEVAF